MMTSLALTEEATKISSLIEWRTNFIRFARLPCTKHHSRLVAYVSDPPARA